MTCNHADLCIYLARANSTVWCCEEFDDRPPVIERKEYIQTAPLKPAGEPMSVGAENAEQCDALKVA